jgi:hypothetical protein
MNRSERKRFTINARFFRMKLLVDQDEKWPPENRKHEWFFIADAMSRASHPETRQLLGKGLKASGRDR